MLASLPAVRPRAPRGPGAVELLTLSLCSAVQNKCGWFCTAVLVLAPGWLWLAAVTVGALSNHPFPPHAPLSAAPLLLQHIYWQRWHRCWHRWTDGHQGTGTTQQRECVRHSRIQMEPRQHHGGLGPRPALRSPRGMSLPARTGQTGSLRTGSLLRSCGTAGSEDPREPLCSTGQAMCPPHQDTTQESPQGGVTSRGVGRGGDGISSTALLQHKELGPGHVWPNVAAGGVSCSGVLAVGTTCCPLLVLLHLYRAQGEAKPALEPGRDLPQHGLSVSAGI